MVRESQKKASRKWDKENMTVVGCKVKKTKALIYKQSCAALGISQGHMLQKAIDEVIKQAGLVDREEEQEEE